MGVAYGINPTWFIQTDSGRAHTSTKRIVQDGLVLNLDAGASISYPGSGNTWTDLSGNSNTGTLTNGPTYSSDNGGVLSFDEVDDYVDIADSTSLQFGTGDFTISVWAYPRKVVYGGSDQGTLVAKNYLGVELFLYEGRFNSYIGGVSNSIIGSIYPLLTNTWYNFVLQREGTSCSSYVNTVLNGSSTNSSSVSQVGTNFNIGRRTGSSAYTLNGNIAHVSMYNRALSTAELSQNFNALRGRYGI
jgi:hypothetical protein